MNPYDFRHLGAGLLRGMGYHIACVLARPRPGHRRLHGPLGHQESTDQGTGETHDGEDYHQRHLAPCWRSSATAMWGSSLRQAASIRVAADEARRQENRRVMLVDLKCLFALWVEHDDEIPEEYRRLLPLKPVYFLVPEAFLVTDSCTYCDDRVRTTDVIIAGSFAGEIAAAMASVAVPAHSLGTPQESDAMVPAWSGLTPGSVSGCLWRHCRNSPRASATARMAMRMA